jgi:ornithine cyclodeaminase
MPPDLIIVRASDVANILAGREAAVLDAVAHAYASHRAQRTSLPHSSFLTIAGTTGRERIIALPALIEDDHPIAGLKWIASFPGNVERGIPRASAVLIANSLETGRPRAILESALISSCRTAASAALAAKALHGGDEIRAGIVGCGVINLEIVRYLKVVMPGLRQLVLYDLHADRAEAFAGRVAQMLPGMECRIVASTQAVFDAASLVSFATVAVTPHVASCQGWSADTTVLHISLRDLSVACVQGSDHVVDDVDHVLRAGTSLHLAQQALGHHEFVRCTLADILAGAAPARTPDRPAVFSPFGLGILDLAVARLVLANGAAELGIQVHDFFMSEPS